jgi:hypothetical protein
MSREEQIGLRDRIAQAIRAGIYRAGDDATDEQTWLACADAVIAELDMGIPCVSTGCRMRQIARGGADDE